MLVYKISDTEEIVLNKLIKSLNEDDNSWYIPKEDLHSEEISEEIIDPTYKNEEPIITLRKGALILNIENIDTAEVTLTQVFFFKSIVVTINAPKLAQIIKLVYNEKCNIKKEYKLKQISLRL